MHSHRIFTVGAAMLLVLSLAALGWLWRQSGLPGTAGPSAEAEFLKVLREAEGRFPDTGPNAPLNFPADHAPHERAAGEAYEFAGWVRDGAGRDHGFRLSFVRLGWLPEPPRRPSAWAAAAAYRGLFALAGTDGFRFRERFERAALDLAGYDPAGRRLWLDAWSLGLPAEAAGGFTLAARVDGRGLELRLRGEKPPVAADGAGAGRLRGYALTRLAAEGTLTMDGAALPVAGSAWLDHAWGRLIPPGGAVAVDRFRLQLDDGRELMVFSLRRRDDSAEPLNRGVLIDAAGRSESLGGDAIRLQPEGDWRSPATGRRYPVAWRLSLPGHGLELSLAPLVEGQEVEGAFTGWSGAVRVRGTGSPAVSGRGFVDVGG